MLKLAKSKLTREGRVKVLDFGLANAMADDLAGADPAKSPIRRGPKASDWAARIEMWRR